MVKRKAVEGKPDGRSLGERTAAQRALAIPEILENILTRALQYDPAYSTRMMARNLRSIDHLWRDTMDCIVLSSTYSPSRGGLSSSHTDQNLDGIIA